MRRIPVIVMESRGREKGCGGVGREMRKSEYGMRMCICGISLCVHSALFGQMRMSEGLATKQR